MADDHDSSPPRRPPRPRPPREPPANVGPATGRGPARPGTPPDPPANTGPATGPGPARPGTPPDPPANTGPATGRGPARPGTPRDPHASADPAGGGSEPGYTLYRARTAEPPPAGGHGAGDPPEYTLYRARPNLLPRLPRRSPDRPGALRKGRPVTAGRIVRGLAVGLVAWLLFALVLFAVSVHLAPGVSGAAKAALDPGGWPLTTPNTILVLGSDQRTAGTHEPGASTSGPSRSDVMLLIRAGAGRAARLSIPRDTVVSIPGHGTAKINAAYAYGGPSLAIETVKRYLGIPINHLVEVSFSNFPALIDALGGVDYTGGCVVSRISGGFRNGGYTLRLRPGTTRLDGQQALALARTRHNDCNPGESDLIRARRQQKIFSAMEHRLLSPSALFHLPWVSWNAPRAIRSDMGAPTLIGLFGALVTGGTPPTRVLKPSGTRTLSDGGVGLVVSAADRRAETARFLAG